MNADTALGAALGAALVGICVGEWVRRRPLLSPPSMFYLEMGVVLVTTALGALLGGCVGSALRRAALNGYAVTLLPDEAADVVAEIYRLRLERAEIRADVYAGVADNIERGEHRREENA